MPVDKATPQQKPAAEQEKKDAPKQEAPKQEKKDEAPKQQPKQEPPKEDGKGKGVAREGRSVDDPVRVLARRAIEIAEAGGASLGSAITAPQAQLVKDRLGSEPGKKFAPATLAQLQNYAQGGRGTHREDVPPETVVKIRMFCAGLDSRRIWPRKVAALVLALEEERTGHVRANTKKKVEDKKAEPAVKAV